MTDSYSKNTTDGRFESWQKVNLKVVEYRKTRNIFLLIIAGISALFMYKISQTPEYLLRYSKSTQEEVGIWVLIILSLVVMVIVFAIRMKTTENERRANQEKVVLELRAILDDASPSLRSETEARLRQIESASPK